MKTILTLAIIIAETKLDSSFPDSQFLTGGMKIPYRLDASAQKDGLLVFVNKDTLSKYLQSFHLSEHIQVIFFEISLKQRKLMVVTIYRPLDQNFDYYLSSSTVVIDHNLQHYKDYIIFGEFNESELNSKMQSFLSQKVAKI